VIPKKSAITLEDRPRPKGRRDRYLPFEPGPNGVPAMASAGEGCTVHMTGLTHDERGYPVMTVECQEQMVTRLVNKITNNRHDIISFKEYRLDDAEVAVVSYGISARTARAAVDEARQEGIKAGMLKLDTVWPFCEEKIFELAQRVKAFVTVEINLGQIHLEVMRAAMGKAPCILVGHAGGALISPERVKAALRGLSK